MNLTLESAILPVISAGGLGGPVLVAIGGLVVIIAILLVFVMVLRSNGDAKKTSRGIGYDANQGPYGQSRAPVSQPGRSRPGGGWGEDYAGPASRPNAGPAASDWASYGNPGAPAAANAGRGGAPGGWGGSPSGQGWGDQQSSVPQWAGPPDNMGQQPQWGGQPAPQAPAGWGAPAGGNDWNQRPPDPQQGWNQQPAPQQAWDQPAPQGAPNQNWNNPPTSPNAPGQDWDAPAPAGAYGGGRQDFGNGAGAGAYAEDQRTYVVRPQTGQGEPRLVVSEGKEQGRSYDLRKDRITIGRSRESDVFLEDLAVSRTHTTINRQANGRYLVRDENSANGTLVNGQRINEHLLEDGDKIQVGQTLLVFVYR
jgi:Inner membrane component of T3SS, cytoplasmic domain